MSNLDFTIFEFDEGNGDDKLSKLHENLPKPPFRWVLLGSTMCGKSTYIMNIIYKWYRDYFDRFYIYIGSEDDINKYRLLTKKYNMGKRVWVSKEVDMDELQELYDKLEEENKKKIVRSLVVFDDQAFNNVQSHSKKKNIIDKILMAGRHINMSFIMSSQQYTALNKNIRSINCSAITVFTCNEDEMKLISDEHSVDVGSQKCFDLLKSHTAEKYSNITVDREKDLGCKFRDKFLNKIPVKKEDGED